MTTPLCRNTLAFPFTQTRLCLYCYVHPHPARVSANRECGLSSNLQLHHCQSMKLSCSAPYDTLKSASTHDSVCLMCVCICFWAVMFNGHDEWHLSRRLFRTLNGTFWTSNLQRNHILWETILASTFLIMYSVHDYSPTTPHNNTRISTLLTVLSTCPNVDRKVINWTGCF